MVDRPPADEKRPLLHWLLQHFPDTPRTRAKQWIQSGRVRVGGVVLRQANHLLEDPGSSLQLLERKSSTLDCGSGWQIHPRLQLLHLDSALTVVNKGPGLISIPAPNSELSALTILGDFLSGKLKPRQRNPAGKSLPQVYRKLQPLPVHRLDQYTTGLFCMALSAAARVQLVNQVKTHRMGREYIAFVEGRAPQAQGTWRHRLRLRENQLQQRIVDTDKGATSDAQQAVTHYAVLAEYPLSQARGVITKLRLRLETGLKHQIRVQAASEGLPLIGDRTYNPNYRGTSGAAIIAFPRQALHSHVLTLEHPDQPQEKLSWTAPLPHDLRELEAVLQSRRI